MSLSKRVRFEVFKRDRFTCQYCGKRPPDVMLEADHIIPRCKGGTDDAANLTTACVACNRGKSGVPLGSVLPALDEMELFSGIQEMLERASSLRKSVIVASAQRAAEDEAVETLRGWWVDSFGHDIPDDGAASLRRFIRHLSIEDIGQAIDSTAAKDARGSGMSEYNRWRYLCGACWQMIKGEATA